MNMKIDKRISELRAQEYSKNKILNLLKEEFVDYHQDYLDESINVNFKLKRCLNCQNINNQTHRYCTKCGNELNPPEKKHINKCSKCSKEYDSDIIYCPNDGTKLDMTEIEIQEPQIKNASKAQDPKEVKYNNDSSESKTLSMNWFRFYTYVRLPISLISSVYSLYIIGLESFYSIILMISIILYGTLIYYFFKKSIRGWDLNWIVLIFEILMYSYMRNALDPLNDTWLISIFVLMTIWFTPNYFYFMKRRHLFK